jgi:hypothetical protein
VGQSGTPEDWRAPEFNLTSIETLCGSFVPNLLNYYLATYQSVVAQLAVTTGEPVKRPSCLGLRSMPLGQRGRQWSEYGDSV